MGGETQQRLAPRDRNGGQVDLLPRRRVSTCLSARITHETEACTLGCKHAALCVRARARRRHQRYLERRGQRFTKGALDPIQCEVDEVGLPELASA